MRLISISAFDLTLVAQNEPLVQVMNLASWSSMHAKMLDLMMILPPLEY